MKNKRKQLFKQFGYVIFSFIGFLLCFGGGNAIIPNLSAHFVANYRIDFTNFIVALIFIIPGLLMIRYCIRKSEKWRYPIGISSLLFSFMCIINYFRLSEYILRKKTGIEAEILTGVVDTYLILGIIILVVGLVLIGQQIFHGKRLSDKSLQSDGANSSADFSD